MDKLTNFFKILSDETRFRIISLLFQKELCVCEICGILDLSQPKVSKHLAKLRDMGFVKDERKEQFIFYSLNINDEILYDLVVSINANIEKFEVLKNDKERLQDKDLYLSQCKIEISI